MPKKRLAAKNPPDSPQQAICTTWNIPDWQDASAYPHSTALSDTLWRWEFLRRCKKYREDWTAHAEGTHRFLLSRSKGKKNVLTPDHPQFRATGEYLLAKVKPGLAQEHEAYRVIRSLRKYGLIGGLPNPAIRGPFMLDFHPSPLGYWETGRGEVEEVLLEKDQALYGFDLTQPITRQLAAAKKFLLREQQRSKGKKVGLRLHRRLLPRYLRVLDARDCGASYEEIGSLLLGIADYDDAAKRGQELYDHARSLQANLSRYF